MLHRIKIRLAMAALALLLAAPLAAAEAPAPELPTSVATVTEVCNLATGACSNESIQVGFDALASCPTPSDGQFMMWCDDDGGIVIMVVVCDRSNLEIDT